MLTVCSGKILRGALFWRWDVQVYLGVGPGEYGVRPDHSTFDIIRAFAAKMRQVGCSAEGLCKGACRICGSASCAAS